MSPEPSPQSPDSPLMPPDLVTTSASKPSEASSPDEPSIANYKLRIANFPDSSEEAEDYVISSSSPREEADKILAAAYAEAASIRNSAQQLWDSTVSRLDSVFSMIREINTYSIEKTDRIRQEFLDQLPSEEAAPPDLSEKIGRIAEQLSEIEEN